MDVTHLISFSIGVTISSLVTQRSHDILRWYKQIRLFFYKLVLTNAYLINTYTVNPGYEPMTKAQLERRYPAHTWQRQAYNAYHSKLTAKDRVFPCVYASKGHIANEQLYMFISSDDPSTVRHIHAIASALRSYLAQSRGLGPNTSLVILSPPPPPSSGPKERNAEDYHRLYWDLLRGLTTIDQKPWPKDIPEETDTLRWCFCFDGQPAFSAVLTPAHHQRHSRYAPNLCIVFQPKWVFDILFSTRLKQETAVNSVRAKVVEYDDIALSPDLKSYGDKGSRECRQYFLLDSNKSAICPYEKLTA